MDTIDGRQLANLMGMAGTAERGGNVGEAYDYYNRVLEVDPSCSEAWIGKGRTAGLQSTLVNVRIGETIVDLGHAIATGGDGAAKRAYAELLPIATAIQNLAQRQADKISFAAINANYVGACSAVLDALTAAEPWDPGNRAGLDLTATVCRNLLNFGVADSFAQSLKTRLSDVNAKLTALDPNYQPPALAHATLADQASNKATMDGLGYIVAFVMIIIAIIVNAAR